MARSPSSAAPICTIDLGDDADNIRLLGQTGRIVVGFGSGGLAVIDPRSRVKLAEIKLAAHPEGFQVSHDEARAFVNIPDAKQIAAIDLETGRQMAA